MTPGDTARVLAAAQSLDNRRTVDEVVVASWHAIIGGLEFEDAVAAVHAHYSRTRDWIMPADVLAGAKLARRERMAALDKYAPDADPDDPQAYIRALREGRRRTDTGPHRLPSVGRVFRAIEGGS